MVRIVCCVCAAVLLTLVNSVIAAPPVTFTPEEPPKFAVLKSADQQALTFLYWKPVIEISASSPPVLVNQPREFSI